MFELSETGFRKRLLLYAALITFGAWALGEGVQAFGQGESLTAVEPERTKPDTYLWLGHAALLTPTTGLVDEYVLDQ